MRKEAASKEVDYRVELNKLGWYREEVFAFVEDGREHMGEEYEEYCLPFRTLYRPARYAAPTVRGVAYEDHAGVVPLILDVERVFGWPCTAEQIYQGSPATLEKANDSLHRMMRQVRYRPHGSFIPMGERWYEDAVTKLLGGPHMSSKELFLHSELWKKRGSSQEMWALMVMLDGRRSPKEVIEREVWLRATGRDTTHVVPRRA